MKYLNYLLIVSFAISSCTTNIEPIDPGLDPNNGGNSGGGNGNLMALFTADIDGVFNDFSSTTEAELTEDGLGIGTLGDPTLVINVFNPAVGTFNVDANNTNTGAVIGYSSGANSLFLPESGSVTISTYDTTTQLVSGTFNAVMSDLAGVDPDIIITNGVFENIIYIETTSVDECEADIDGVLFEADFFASAETGNSLGITFSSSLNEQLSITFPLNSPVGTYPFEDLMSGGTVFASYENTSGVNFRSVPNSGNLVITSVTGGIIQGTFSFTGAEAGNPSNTISVTNGSFVFDNN